MFRCKQFVIEDSQCAMKVSTDALILGSWSSVSDGTRCLDIGCGSGILTLMLLQKSADTTRVDAIDVDANAVAQTQNNILQSNWSERGRAVQCNLEDWQAKPYDTIICNPPYFDTTPTHASQNMTEERRQARQQSTLSLSSLMMSVKRLMTENGRFSVMYPWAQKSKVIKEAINAGLILSCVQDVKSTPEKSAYLTLFEFTLNAANSLQECPSLVIRENQDYTDEFKQLCKDFYLRF